MFGENKTVHFILKNLPSLIKQRKYHYTSSCTFWTRTDISTGVSISVKNITVRRNEYEQYNTFRVVVDLTDFTEENLSAFLWFFYFDFRVWRRSLVKSFSHLRVFGLKSTKNITTVMCLICRRLTFVTFYYIFS